MAKLLHIESSPRKERSSSIATTRELLDAYRAANPHDEVETWDLWAQPLPELDGPAIEASYLQKRGGELNPAQQAGWDALQAAFDRFASADKYVFSVPMWNFGVPYKFKQFVDVVTQSGLAFQFTPEGGYEGLLTGRPAAVVHASGGEYATPQMQALDHQQPYVDLWLGFVGVTDVRTIKVAPTASDPESVEAAKQQAAAQARTVGATL